MNIKPEQWEEILNIIHLEKEEEIARLLEREPWASNIIDCQNYIGWIYYEVDSFDKAFYWFSMAAISDNSEAHYGLACLSFIQKDYKNAFDCYLIALNKGFTRSNYWLGIMYESGLGIEKNIEKAKEYYMKGAKCGYLISERAYIQIKFRYSSFFQKLLLLPKYISLLFKGFNLARYNIDDERLSDIPSSKKP